MQAEEIKNKDDYRCKEYKYASKNVGHIFATKLDQQKLQKMFEERYENSFNSNGVESKGDPPYLVNLHNGSSK